MEYRSVLSARNGQNTRALRRQRNPVRGYFICVKREMAINDVIARRRKEALRYWHEANSAYQYAICGRDRVIVIPACLQQHCGA